MAELHSRRHLFFFVLLLAIVLLVSTKAYGDATASDKISEADRVANELEEQAAAAVGEAAEEEEDDDADALDEDADAARYDPERRHPLTDLPPSADDVSIGHAFLTNFSETKSKQSDIVVTLGNSIKTVVAFSNEGKSRYHVWGVMGSLNTKDNFKIFVQNFTYQEVNKSVHSNEELSFSYTFTPNARLDILPFQLAVTLFYEAQGSSGNAIRGHSTTFFNETVATEPSPQAMSNSVFVLVFTVVIGAAIGAVFVLRRAGSSKASHAEMGTEDSSKNEWLAEHETMARTGGGRAKIRSADKE